ncbi:MAG TPA: nuclease-related domain-containing protein [Nocardioides sp.]|uniref:nuclease-related domain-containing protein n=1 Tax=Nocardioides sp. TaxID=35761 RepID=UPI002EDACD85
MPNDSGGRRRTAERTYGVGAVRQILSALPADEWAVLPDVRLPGHAAPALDIAVGPGGVFVVESRLVPRRLRRDDINEAGVRQDIVVSVTAAAFTVSRLSGLAGPAHVHPVVCFVGRELEPSSAGDVVLCSTDNLLAVLADPPRVLEPAESQLIALEVDAVSGARTPIVARRRRWFGPQFAGLVLAAVASVGLWQVVDGASQPAAAASVTP